MADWVKDFGSSDAPFNMALLFYLTLNDLIKAKDNAYMNNNIYLWFKYLDRIYNKIIFKLNPKEIEGLELQFTKSKQLILNNGEKKDISEILHNIDKDLIKLMDKYKMIFPTLKGLKGLNNIDERYNLKEEK